MPNILQSIALVTVSGLLPILVGGYVALQLRASVKREWMASLATGMFLFLFVDLMNGASQLGVEFGFSGTLTQTALVIAFALGLLFPSTVEARYSTAATAPLLTSLLFGVGIGLHGVGEGIVIGYDLARGFQVNVAYGMQGLSYALHKAAEGLAIAVPLRYLKAPNYRKFIYPGLVAGTLVIVGAFLGLVGAPGIWSTYFFSLGAAANVYIMTKLFSYSTGEKNRFLGFLIGGLFMYFAALIHTTKF